MLQTGMRAPMGIKVKGQNLKQIEAFGIQLEGILKQVKGVKKKLTIRGPLFITKKKKKKKKKRRSNLLNSEWRPKEFLNILIFTVFKTWIKP